MIEELFKTQYSKLFKRALSLTQNKEIAEEIVQEAFLSFKPNAKNPKGYLMGTVTKYSFNRRRREIGKQKRIIKELINNEPLVEKTTNIEKNDYTELYSKINKLTPKQKQYVYEYYFLDLDPKEIGQKYKTTGAAVRESIRLAIIKLKEQK